MSTSQLVALLKDALAEDVGIPRGAPPSSSEHVKDIHSAFEQDTPGMVAVVDECPTDFRRANFQQFNRLVQTGGMQTIPGPMLVVESRSADRSRRDVCIPNAIEPLPEMGESMRAAAMDALVDILATKAVSSADLIKSIEKCQKQRVASKCEAVDPSKETDSCMYFGSGCFNRNLIEQVTSTAAKSRGLRDDAVKDNWAKIQNIGRSVAEKAGRYVTTAEAGGTKTVGNWDPGATY